MPSKTTAVIASVCILGFVAAVAVYASNGFTDAAAVDRGAIHGRKALRMDHLHRVKSHSASHLNAPALAKNGKCATGQPGIEVSKIELSAIVANDGPSFWASKSDPYVTLKLNGLTQQTKIKKDKSTASFDGVFCFEGKAAVDAFAATGLTVTAEDSDMEEWMAGEDDLLGTKNFRHAVSVSTLHTLTKAKLHLKVAIISGATGGAPIKGTAVQTDSGSKKVDLVDAPTESTKSGEAATATKSTKYCAHRCTKPRVRKDFALLTAAERTTYIKALNEAKASGVYEDFVKVHTEKENDHFAHRTAGFLPWHRKFLLEFENALRCLGEEYQCVTIPYWDWAEWAFFCNLEPAGCKSYADIPNTMKEELGPDAKNILVEFGGSGHKGKMTEGATKTWGSTGHPEGVGCVSEGPFKHWVDWEGHCLSRGNDWALPHPKNKAFTNMNYLIMIMADEDTYGGITATSANGWQRTRGYRSEIQNQPHNNQHNYLGGHMRSMRSPFDPIFFSHHAMIDKQWSRWQDCHDHETVGTDKSAFAATHYKGNTVESAIDKEMPFNLPLNQFKRGDGKKFVGQDDGLGYQWDHDKQGAKPRDWLIVSDKIPASPYHFQWDSFHKIIAKSCSMSGGGEGATALGENVPGAQQATQATQATQAISQSFIEEHLVATARTGKIVSFEHFAKALIKATTALALQGVKTNTKKGKKQVIRAALGIEAKDQCKRSTKSFGAVFCDCNAPSAACKSDCAFNEAFGTGDAPGMKKRKDFCMGVGKKM